MELTNIEVLVFENENGEETEMQIVDEFIYEGAPYIALVSADCEDGDDISVYRVIGDGDYEEIGDADMKDKLLDIIEERVMERF